jgi:hypothetical protein
MEEPKNQDTTKTFMKHTRLLFLIAFLYAGAAALPSLRGATTTVMNTNDNGPGSLRQALADALDGDKINFDSSLNGQTITLTSGELLVNKSVAISGPGANTLAVDAEQASRVFNIASGKDVTISDLTVTNGSAPLPYRWGGGIYNDHATLTLNNCTVSGNTAVPGSGGGIYNDADAGSATLTITNCTISGNSAWPGGGIYNHRGTVTITNSTLSGNSDNGYNAGGAIFNQGTLTITSSTFSGNSGSAGGGIYNGGTATMTNSTFSGNSASSGGGIYNDWNATMTNCTFSGNSAGSSYNVIYNGTGGGIWNAQILTMTNCTLSGNSATNHGGGIYNAGVGGGATTILKIGHTILNAGTSDENIYNDNIYYAATVTSLGYNVSSDNGGGLLTATGDQVNIDPKLGPLQDNGGPAFTHLPASDSPAIDAGDPTLGMDQRGPGFQRVANGRIDVGAVEAQTTAKPPASVQVTVQTNPAGLAFSVDGAPYTSTKTFSWVPASSHTIATTSPQGGSPGLRYVWMNWAGGGAISHTVAPATNKTYTANFRTQYQLTMSHGTGGKVSPTSGWRNSGTIISTSATPNSGYSFSNWAGSGNGSYSGTSNPASITMNGPVTQTATFTHN